MAKIETFSLRTYAIAITVLVGLVASSYVFGSGSTLVSAEDLAAKVADQLQCIDGTRPAVVCQDQNNLGRGLGRGAGQGRGTGLERLKQECHWECIPFPKPTTIPRPTITREPKPTGIPPISPVPLPTACSDVVCPLTCTRTVEIGGCDICKCPRLR